MRRRTRLTAITLACLVTGAAHALTASAATGAWELALNDTNRKCRLVLRQDSVAAGHALAMPAGCRRALPILADVVGWNVPDDRNLVFADAGGQPVLTFAAAGPTLVATGPEGETYELVSAAAAPDTVPRFTVAQAQQQPPRAPTAPRTPAAATPQVRTGDVIGRYAVVRDGGKDTGCMVTLSEQARGRGFNRAQLAPACRDQGIVIFDPIGWHIERGQLVLQARKGHKTNLENEGDGLWMKKDAKPLGLKRL